MTATQLSVEVLRAELMALERRIDGLAGGAPLDSVLLDLALLHRDAAYTALDVGDAAVAMTHSLSCLELARRSGDVPMQAKAHVVLALVLGESFDDQSAARHFQLAEQLSKDAGDDRGVALVAVNASHDEMERRSYGAATERLYRFLASEHARGLDLGQEDVLHDTFHINFVVSAAEALMQGAVEPPRRAGIERQLRQSAALVDHLKNEQSPINRPFQLLEVLDALTRFALWRDDLPGALEFTDERVRLAVQASSTLQLGQALSERARVHALAGRWAQTIEDAELAVVQFESAGQELWVARSREALASAYAQTGRFREAFEAQQEVTRQVELLFRAYHQQRALVRQIELQARDAEVRAGALAEAALRDPLTGAPNRTHAMQQLAALQLQAQRGVVSAVVLMDLDHFKSVNDTHGHAVGDAVLIRTIQTLAAEIRDLDCLARFGGEEFMVILTGLTLEGALEVCERLRRVLASLTWDEVAPGLNITASFGVAVLDGRADVGQILQAADEALYAAKAAGRNAVRHAAQS
jgi:diguanylate cyclase (GGDEF)-like protein